MLPIPDSKEGTPVVVGGGDCQLGTIGVGATEPNQAAVFGGSFWQYEFNTASGATDPQCRVRVNCHAVPGHGGMKHLHSNLVLL